MVQESDSGTPTGGDSYDSEGSVDVDEAGLMSEIVVPTQSPSPASASGDNSDSGSDRAPSTSMSTTNCSTSTFMTPVSTAPRRSDSRLSSRSRSCTPQPQGTLDSVCAPDTKATEKLHYAVTHYIVTCNRPLNTVEKPGFRDMLQTFKPGYKVLSRRVLTDEYIPKVKEQVVDHLKTLLRGGGLYSLTSDNWTSNADVPYASLTAHFFDKEWENLHAVTLSCRASQESHNGEMMKEFFEEALDSWGLPVERCVALTTDNASDMRLAAESELMDLPHMRCIAHTIQHGAEAVFKTAWVKKHNGEKAKKLPTTSPTRWWTELNLLECVAENVDLLRQFAEAYARGRFQNVVPGAVTMYIVHSVIRALKPIEQICTNLSADTYVTASAFLPVIHLLEVGFEDDEVDLEIELTTEEAHLVVKDSLSRAALRRPILAKLHKRFSPSVLDEEDIEDMTPQMAAQARINHRCAVKCNALLTKVSFLDPRYRDELTVGERELAREKLKAEFQATLTTTEGAEREQNSPAPVKPSMSRLFAKRRRTMAVDGGIQQQPRPRGSGGSAATPELLFVQELARYENSPKVDIDLDIRMWWKERVDSYPRLAAMARKYLCVPATSTCSERLFSTGGNVVTDTSTCLGGDLSETLIFLSSNKAYIKKPQHR
ncbi:E3 SUMO-protein ligase ZBED1 [Frankliniella fusca]|uniref:E3 SUMO-protein ligase ZBED1 n=1 Tax=Frankliniella fusca TaxID=407009 RepID=A0AAE1LHP1_9NEOP|nr:E3 SUMO-protein ligase ZBED1 [Frankliniella fusca]